MISDAMSSLKNIRKEIGSEFWDIPLSDHRNFFFRTDTQWFLSGRSALECLIEHIQTNHRIKSVAMPAWCCDSMVKPFVSAGIKVCFYPVYFENGRLVQDYSNVSSCDALFLMDYFGYSGYSNEEDFRGLRIRDLTHSVFSGNYNDADFYFGSLRKWAGFFTGGFGWGMTDRNSAALSENTDYIALRQRAMKEKEAYISGLTDSKGYLALFAEAEEILDNCNAGFASKRDMDSAAFFDIEGMKVRRRNNAAYLINALSDFVMFPSLDAEDCPLFVPILVPDGMRDRLRRYLIMHEIYCPVHWPLTEYHSPDSRTQLIYKNELSIVCDQRYDLCDMERLVLTINKFWKE